MQSSEAWISVEIFIRNFEMDISNAGDIREDHGFPGAAPRESFEMF